MEIIETFIFNNTNRFNECMKNKFIKRVLQFFCPSNISFVNMDWKPNNDFV